jgi:hypothetical protein
MVGEYEEDYLKQDYTQKIIGALSSRSNGDIPEANAIVSLISEGEKSLNYTEYTKKLGEIYKNYVHAKFQSFVAETCPNK